MVTILFNAYNSKMVQDTAILTMANQQKVVHGLSNGAICNDLERPLMEFQGHAIIAGYLTNGYRYGHRYYKLRIGNRTQVFD